MAFLKDEEKQSLLNRYFDIEWCNDVSDLRCVRCHRVAINHYVSSCQHIFCKMCSKFYGDEEQPLNCSRCQEQITQPEDKSFEVEIKIHQLWIYCPNKKHGCKYADQLRKIPEASLSAESTAPIVVTSLNVVIGELRESIREVGNNMEKRFGQLESKIDDNERKFNTLLERVANVEKKAETNAGMELSSKGWTEELQSMKSQLETIIKKNESLLQKKISSNAENIRIKMASMTQDIKALQHKNSGGLHHLKSETYEWTIKDVKKNIQKKKWAFESDAIMFIGYQYEMKAMLDNLYGSLCVCLQLKDDAVDRFLKKREFTSVKFIVRDQRNVKKKDDVIREAHLKFDECASPKKFIFEKFLPNDILSPPYVKKDRMKITIIFEPSSVDRSFIVNNGVLLWRVDDYKTTSMEQMRYCEILSPSFYTSPQGYKVKIKLFKNYSEEMILIVYFLTGEHDATLSLSFPHKTTVTLFNQTDPLKKLVIESEQRKDAKSYRMMLDGSELLEQNGFVKDDSLLLKVEIEAVSMNERMLTPTV